MKNVIYILLLLSCTSCLKKIEEVETANTNIFDPEYGGEQWWVFQDVYSFTNINNDQFIRFEITIPEENAPNLKPPHIDLGIKVNDAGPYVVQANINYTGGYLAVLDIPPSGSANFCLEVGVYVEETELIINSFTECKDL